ncbi:MAG: cytochrome c [Deferribacterales bacterium]
MKKTIGFIVFLTAVSTAFAAADGAALYAKCKGCHGADGSKKALGVSGVIKGQSAKDIEADLKGYQAGEGGAKKAIMQSQVAKLTPEEIKALADYISKLK